VHLTQEPERVVIAIDDDGPGVPPSQRDRGRGQGTQGTSKTVLGELVSATGADSLSTELAGLLLAALGQASSAPQTRGAGAGAAKPSFSGATGQPVATAPGRPGSPPNDALRVGSRTSSGDRWDPLRDHPSHSAELARCSGAEVHAVCLLTEMGG
jgi:hypothetical protein